ncbi:MAG TPA: DUF6603 domain-containing protein [Thermoanaerobaculia bacterium]|nr:DUF6603 domain-containing protein [Thermoanaerobaculia bacterium]
MSGDTLRRLAEELAQALVPLEEAVSSPQRFAALLREMGWDFDGAVPPPVAALAAGLADLRAALDAVLNGTPSLQELDDLRAAIRELVDAVRALADLPPGSFPAELEAAGFLDEFPARLVELLVVTHFQHNHPRLETVLRALGIVRAELVPAAADRPPHVTRRLALPDFAELLRDPAVVLERVYGWGTADFRYQDVLEQVADLVASFGLDVYIDELDPRLVRVLEAGATLPARPIRWSLKVPLAVGDVAGAAVEAGVGLFALPAQGAHLPGLSLLPYAEGGLLQRVQLSERVSLVIEAAADLTAGVGVVFRPDEPIELLTDVIPSADAGVAPPSGGRVRVRLEVGEAEGGPTVLLGADGIGRVEVSSISLTGEAEVDSAGRRELGVELDLHGAALVVSPEKADGFLRSLLPAGESAARFDLALGLSAVRGFYFRGSGALQVSVPAHVELGGIAIDAITVGAVPAGGAIPVEIGASMSARLGPLTARVENVGLRLTFSFPDAGGNLGLLDLAADFKPPTGVGLAVDGGGFKGGGFLSFEPEQARYTGILELEFQDQLTVKAIGLLDTRLPNGQTGFSLLIVISSEFTPIQLGFGFKLDGVGGLLGLNRTVNTDRLVSGLRDNTLNSILFPTDVVANADRILSDLRQVFPPAPGRFVFGPMAKISWGTPALLTADIGLIVELPEPVRLAVLGVVRGILPDERAAILRLQVNFLGVIDFEKEQFSFDASLFDSKLLGFTLTGDMAVRLYWGADANFLATVGGFHPAYQPPPMNLPALRRLTLALVAGDNPRLTLETYFALTSNTVQLGARLELYAAAWKFNAYGFLSFDVLFQFNPFYFIAEVTAMLALRVGSSSIASIKLTLTLEGPTPWKAKGDARLRLCWFLTVKVRFNKTFGETRNTVLPDLAVLPLLLAALSARDNWEDELPAERHRLESRREIGAAAAADETFVHPVGTLKISQKVAPLNIVLDRIGSQRPADARQFAIDAVQVGADAVTPPAAQESFAPAQFFDLSDEEKLASPSFKSFDSGIRVGEPDRVRTGYAAARAVQYELKYIDSQREQSGAPGGGGRFDVDPSAFDAWALQGAIAQSPLSFARRRKSALAPEEVGVLQESFAIVTASDLKPFDGGSLLGSERAALKRRDALIAANPALRGELQVVPAFEVAA